MEESLTQRFYNLLLEYSRQSDPAQRKQIEDTLWREFGTERTVFVLDMSGFSLLTQKYGIIHYLSMVRRMQLTAQPIIESHGGRVVKFEADNCFAVFPAPCNLPSTPPTLSRRPNWISASRAALIAAASWRWGVKTALEMR
jgi:class 3 adenylate cyclase